MAFVLADLYSLEARTADHIVKFAARECRSHRSLDMFRQATAEPGGIFGNFLVHLKPAWTFKVSDEQGPPGFEDSVDFPKHRKRIVKDMQDESDITRSK